MQSSTHCALKAIWEENYDMKGGRSSGNCVWWMDRDVLTKCVVKGCFVRSVGGHGCMYVGNRRRVESTKEARCGDLLDIRCRRNCSNGEL